MAVGLPYAFGAKDMHPYIERLGEYSDAYVVCCPHAGLPNVIGGYVQTGPEMAEELAEFSIRQLCNVEGKNCGITPLHVDSFATVHPFNAAVQYPQPTSLTALLQVWRRRVFGAPSHLYRSTVWRRPVPVPASMVSTGRRRPVTLPTSSTPQ